MARSKNLVPSTRHEVPQPRGGGPFHFRVSSALKRIIGRDLITDEFVAIFELVKNSFDAHAKRVDVAFIGDTLFIIDDGKGMSASDIHQKWLFVAYSAKKEKTEDELGYRDQIGERKKEKRYAGSKGVGRFSCDRLGDKLRMQTKHSAANSRVEVLEIRWSDFEENAQTEFASIPLSHRQASKFTLPKDLPPIKTGTVLEIGGLREQWGREKLLRLRAALAKLINPFGGTSDGFTVHLTAPAELEADKTSKKKAVSKEALDVAVNGPVRNFIFESLKGKTTHLSVVISAEGSLVSTLTDRGTIIYKIQEKNPFNELVNSGFNCNLYYLNRSAKKTFAHRMGVNSVAFGSVFLFRNGFRIYPIGDEGVDTFGIDRRKQQGYARFLGTRDIIGRIDVAGDNERFRESTSRNQGLIETPAYLQLKDCFNDICLKRLERYVVGVNWKDALDLDSEDTSRLHGDQASARITAVVAHLAGAEGVKLLNYNQDLIRVLNERSDEFSESLSGLRKLAEKAGNKDLLADIQAANTRYLELQRAEVAARETAEQERLARRNAERKAAKAEQEVKHANKVLEEEKKRNLFLTSLTSLDRETIEILHHQIIIHASAVNEIVKGQVAGLRRRLPTKESLLSTFENLSFQNRKVLSIARFATKANFRLESEAIREDLAMYFVEYIERVAPMFSDTGIRAEVTSSAKGLVRKFKPIEVAILVDNLISNAGRAGAAKISFAIEQPANKELRITVHDNGRGFDPSLIDLTRVFEKGFTTTEGSGLGLFHVAQILDDLGGSITAERQPRGASFVIRIKS